MIERVLRPDCPDIGLFQPGPSDFFGDDEIVSQLDVALGFLGVRTEAELLDLFEDQTANPDDVKVENGVLGDRVVPHLEDDSLVGASRPLHFPAGDGPELVGRPGVTGNTGIGGR